MLSNLEDYYINIGSQAKQKIIPQLCAIQCSAALELHYLYQGRSLNEVESFGLKVQIENYCDVM